MQMKMLMRFDPLFSKRASQFSECANRLGYGIVIGEDMCAKSWKRIHERGKTMRGPEAGINDGTCGTRSPRYCRPGAIIASQEEESERDGATLTAHTESFQFSIDSFS